MIPLNNLSSRTKYEKNDFLNLTSPLMIIFENAIETGVYPANWKRGNIVPVHKKESKKL